jgi:hypothetical protein
MPPIVTTAEIDRLADRVFACATDPSLFPQWQKGVTDGHMEGPADGTQVPAVGAKCVTTRRIGGASHLRAHAHRPAQNLRRQGHRRPDQGDRRRAGRASQRLPVPADHQR